MRRARFLAAAATGAAMAIPVTGRTAEGADGLRLLRDRGCDGTPFARVPTSDPRSMHLRWTSDAVRLIQSGATTTCAGTRRTGDRRAALYELDATPVPLRLVAVWRGNALTDVAAAPQGPFLALTLPTATAALPPPGFSPANIAALRQSQSWMTAVMAAVVFAVQAEWPEHDLQNGFSSGSSPGSGSFAINATRDEWRRLSPARAHDVLGAMTAAVKRLYGLQQPDRPAQPIVAAINAVDSPAPGAPRRAPETESALAQTIVVPDRWAAVT